jgi:hypothetical protein
MKGGEQGIANHTLEYLMAKEPSINLAQDECLLSRLPAVHITHSRSLSVWRRENTHDAKDSR